MIYLDNSATTRPYPEVVEEVRRCMEEDFGNPSSLHALGVEAERQIKNARRTIAARLGASDREIIFTSGGTEADNAAIYGVAQALRRRGDRIITTRIEHPAVLEACSRLKASGFEIVTVDPDNCGRIDPGAVEAHVNDRTILISVMHVNNEVGTIQPIEAIGAMARRHGGICFHSDAVQSFGKLPFSPDKACVDLASLSAHKIHGPKGVGALYIKHGCRIEPFLTGGGQESGLRSGTENVPGIAGFATAVERIFSKRIDGMKQLADVKAALLNGIRAEISDVHINGYEDERSSPAILNVSFEGIRAEVLLHMLEQHGIYVSTGSACSSRKKGQSHVLKAMGLPDDRIEGAIRFSFSEYNTIPEMQIVLERLKGAVQDIRRTMKGKR